MSLLEAAMLLLVGAVCGFFLAVEMHAVDRPPVGRRPSVSAFDAPCR